MSVTTIDVNDEVLEIARTKPRARENVVFRIVVEKALQILRLKFQILMPHIRQRILAVDGVEEPHG